MPLFTKPQFNSVWASTGAKLTPDIAKISQGWVVEIPPHEFDNWMQNRQDALLAHLNQLGIPQWDATVEYQAGKSYVQGTTAGVVYKALTTHTNVNPETDIQNNWVVAFQSSGTALLKVNNLSDVPDKAQARVNLGIATTEFYDTRYLLKSTNLADVPNKASARNNLGLGNSSTLNIGTTVNTVAAGDDSRIVNAASKFQVVRGINGLVGAANLDAPVVEIGLGTPSTITAVSSNSSSGTTHSHALDIASFIGISGGAAGRAVIGSIQIRWGVLPAGSNEESVIVNFVEPFPNACLSLQITPVVASANPATATMWWQINFKNQTGFSAFRQRPAETTTAISGEYFAIGW